MRKTINAPPQTLFFLLNSSFPKSLEVGYRLGKTSYLVVVFQGFACLVVFSINKFLQLIKALWRTKNIAKKLFLRYQHHLQIGSLPSGTLTEQRKIRHFDGLYQERRLISHCFVSLKECSLDFLHAISRPAPPKSAWLKPNTWWNQPHHWSQFLCGRRQLYKKGPPDYYKWIYP